MTSLTFDLRCGLILSPAVRTGRCCAYTRGAPVEPRNNRPYRRAAAALRRMYPTGPCAYCDQAIDPTLHHLNRGAWTADHIITVNDGGPDSIDNLRPMHRGCNTKRENDLRAARRLSSALGDTARVW